MRNFKFLSACLLTLFSTTLFASEPAKLFEINGAYEDAVVDGNHLFLAANKAEGATPDLQVYRLDKNGKPESIGNYRSKDYAHSIAKKNQFLYLVDGKFGLEVLDIRTPTKPELVSFLPLDGYSHKIAIQNNLAVVASGFQGLHLIDISKPLHPRLISTYQAYPPPQQSPTIDNTNNNPTFGGAEDYDNQREASGGGDVNITWEDLITTEGALDVTLQGHYAYIAYGSTGIVTVDISNPAQPVKLSTFKVQHAAESLTIERSIIYVTLGLDGLRAIDMAHPKTPVGLARFSGRCYAMDVSAFKNKVFVADGLCTGKSLYVFDATDNSHLRKEMSFSDRVTNVKLFNHMILAMGPKHVQAFKLKY